MFTNRGLFLMYGWVFRGVALPTNFYAALCTNATPPTVDINTLGELTQIAVGNGYTDGGIQLSRNATDFDVLTENDTDDRVELQLRNLVWTAAGGTLPASGAGARWLALCTDEVTVANRQVVAYHDLQSDRQVSDGQPLTIIDAELRGTHPA